MALRQLYRNTEKYRDSLSLAIKEVDASQHGHKQLSKFAMSKDLKALTHVSERHPGGKKELVYPPESPSVDEREEVVVTVQGYAVRCNLPPITRPDQIPKNPVSAKQAITLTGLGSTEFELAARAVLQIHTLFSSTVPEDALTTWKPIRDAGNVCLEFTNRYFRGKDDQDAAAFELGKDIDPLGILRSKCPTGEHTEDNRVLYFERSTDILTGNNTYLPCNPVAIKVGQLVEVQASFCVVPIAKGKFIMLHKLRSICILSAQVQEDINEALFMSSTATPLSPTRKTKRSVGYTLGDEQPDLTEGARVKMKRMRIDEEIDS